jgi:hypothetical protein
MIGWAHAHCTMVDWCSCCTSLTLQPASLLSAILCMQCALLLHTAMSACKPLHECLLLGASAPLCCMFAASAVEYYVRCLTLPQSLFCHKGFWHQPADTPPAVALSSLASGNFQGCRSLRPCVRAQPSTCCFLDAEGLVPPKLLQLDELLSTCQQRCQLRLPCTVGVRQCMHASDLLACGGGLGVGSHSVLHACTVSFYNSNARKWVH